jgi:hypothetical protein
VLNAILTQFGQTLPNNIRTDTGITIKATDEELTTPALTVGDHYLRLYTFAASTTVAGDNIVTRIPLTKTGVAFNEITGGALSGSATVDGWAPLAYMTTNNLDPASASVGPCAVIIVLTGHNISDIATLADKRAYINNLSKFGNVTRFVVAPALDLTTGVDVGGITLADRLARWAEIIDLAGGEDNVFTYNAGNNAAIDLTVEGTGTTAEISTIIQNLFSGAITAIRNRLTKVRHIPNNALHVHTSNIQGVSQAGTRTVTDAQFGGVAMHYALSDNSGFQIVTSSTKTATGFNNALYVTLNVPKPAGTGVPGSSGYDVVSKTTPMYVTFDKPLTTATMFDLKIDSSNQRLPATNADISGPDSKGKTFNLNTLGIVNETPVPIWVKLYDICSTEFNAIAKRFNTAVNTKMFQALGGAAVVNDNTVAQGGGFAAQTAGETVQYTSRILLNLAVPPYSTRDLGLAYPIKINNGLFFSASSNFRYTEPQYPAGNNSVYVHGSWSRLREGQ